MKHLIWTPQVGALMVYKLKMRQLTDPQKLSLSFRLYFYCLVYLKKKSNLETYVELLSTMVISI